MNAMKNVGSVILLGVLLIVAGTKGHAQTPSILLAEVSGPSGNQSIAVAFSVSLTTDDLPAATNSANYFVLDMGNRRAIRIASATFLNVPGLDPTFLTLTVDPAEFINLSAPGARYLLFAENLTFGKQPTKNPLQAKLGAKSVTPTSPPFLIKESKGRQDSNVYVAGELSGASGTGVFASVDIKVELPLNTQNFWQRTHVISPFFDLRASTSPDADPDSLNTGLRWSFPAWSRKVKTPAAGQLASAKPYSDLHWDNAGKIEANRDFANVNALWESRFTLPLSFLNTRRTKLLIDPYVGTELGKNVKSPVQAAENKTIARFMAGTTMNVVFPFQRDDLDLLVLEAAYIRRWPLKEEVTFTKDNTGTLVPLFIGKSPRDFVEAKLHFKFNKFFGAYSGYEYGELPPLYKLVDHRFRAGLVYKFRVDRDARK